MIRRLFSIAYALLIIHTIYSAITINYELDIIKQDNSPFLSLDFYKEDKCLIASGYKLLIYDLNQNKFEELLEKKDGWIIDAKISPDYSKIIFLSGYADGGIFFIYDIN